jgi:cyanuric acid amidohydrolase
MAWDCSVYKFAMAGPDDVSGLESLLASGAFKAQEIICIIAKTEGNGRVNDFSRPLAHRVFRDLERFPAELNRGFLIVRE